MGRWGLCKYLTLIVLTSNLLSIFLSCNIFALLTLQTVHIKGQLQYKLQRYFFLRLIQIVYFFFLQAKTTVLMWLTVLLVFKQDTRKIDKMMLLATLSIAIWKQNVTSYNPNKDMHADMSKFKCKWDCIRSKYEVKTECSDISFLKLWHIMTLKKKDSRQAEWKCLFIQ